MRPQPRLPTPFVPPIQSRRRRGLRARALAAAVFSGFAGGAARAAEPPKIGVVDVDALMYQSILGNRVGRKLQAVADEAKEQLRGIEDEVVALQAERKLRQGTLSQEELQKLEAKILSANSRLKREMDTKQRALAMTRNEAGKKFNLQLGQVLQEFLKSEGYDLLLQRQAQGVLAVGPRIDVTEEVRKLLDRRHP